MLMLIHPAQAEFIKDNFKSIYSPILLKADGFLPSAFFLILYPQILHFFVIFALTLRSDSYRNLRLKDFILKWKI
jgi:hypothetical protein